MSIQALRDNLAHAREEKYEFAALERAVRRLLPDCDHPFRETDVRPDCGAPDAESEGKE